MPSAARPVSPWCTRHRARSGKTLRLHSTKINAGGLATLSPQPPAKEPNGMKIAIREARIRKARIEDAAAIAHVHVESWKTTYSGIVSDEFLASLNKEERTRMWQEQIRADTISMLVAEDGTGIFGFAAGGELREKRDDYDAELYAIYLLHERQKQGVGRRLSLALASALKSRGLRSMLVWVLEQNPSVSFYERLGAVRVARKAVNIGGADLEELAYGWPSIDRMVAAGDQEQLD
jgi:GNAT superfamily N-acetyltransferase